MRNRTQAGRANTQEFRVLHYICLDCAGDNPKVLRDRMPVWFNCCWCGENTCGQLLEAKKAPCENTCRPVWEQATPQPAPPASR
jgi:hypothetical protein